MILSNIAPGLDRNGEKTVRRRPQLYLQSTFWPAPPHQCLPGSLHETCPKASPEGDEELDDDARDGTTPDA